MAEGWDERTRQREGCYILRTNAQNWTPEQLWKTYIQLWEVEAAFRIYKSKLSIRPIWHHKEKRVQAHILVCFWPNEDIVREYSEFPRESIREVLRFATELTDRFEHVWSLKGGMLDWNEERLPVERWSGERGSATL